jgi:hypothetical protein
MNEKEYIDATNLAKLRTAYTIVKDCLPMRLEEESQQILIRRALRNWIDELEPKVICVRPSRSTGEVNE